MLALLGLEPRPFVPKPLFLPIKLLRLDSEAFLAVQNSKNVQSEPEGGTGCIQEVAGLYPIGNETSRPLVALIM